MSTAPADATRVGLISDTHGKLRSEVFAAFEGVDLILHAGDIGNAGILTELEASAPVFAVHGNTDSLEIAGIAPADQSLVAGGRSITVVHGHLLGSPTPRALRERFPDCDVIVYGHTHKPLVDATERPLVINPGAAGPARFNLKPTVAILTLSTLQVEFHELP